MNFSGRFSVQQFKNAFGCGFGYFLIHIVNGGKARNKIFRVQNVIHSYYFYIVRYRNAVIVKKAHCTECHIVIRADNRLWQCAA